MNTWTLSQVAVLLGALGIAATVWWLLASAQVRRLLESFPRSIPAAWTLTAVDLLWVAWIVYHASLGRFEYLKPSLFFLTPVCFFLLINFLDDLLAPRAFGGLLLLAANPILIAAQWHPSDWRLAVTALAYAWAVAGMALVLSPYLFRRVTQRILASPQLTRLSVLAKLVGGIALVVLGLTVF